MKNFLFINTYIIYFRNIKTDIVRYNRNAREQEDWLHLKKPS